MNVKSSLIRIFIVLTILVVPTGSALAQEPGGDVILFGQNYTLPDGETLNGSLVVFGGNISIGEDATVNGDIVLIGGNLSASGVTKGDAVVIGGNAIISDEVNGDIVVIGGQINLSAASAVKGDVIIIGGQVHREPGAQVGGRVMVNAPPISSPRGESPSLPNRRGIDYSFNPLWEGMQVLFRAVGVAAVGMLLALFLQPQLERTGSAMTNQPLLAGGYGLLAIIVLPIAIVIMAITILLLPVALIVALAIPLAWIFGMVALGQEVGERFTKAINQTWAPVLTAGFGTFLTVLVAGFVGMIPCVGWLASFLVTLVALGGTAMTLFGSRPAPGSTMRPMQVEEIPPAS